MPTTTTTPLTAAALGDIQLLLADGRPLRLTWRGRRFQVSDEPTPIRDRVDAPGITHPLEPLIGWRFQGTDAAGDSFVFDVHRSAGGWLLAAVYD